MSLRAFAYEEVVHEPCCKSGKLRVKKRFRLHAIEEFAAQQLVVLPILTSPSPLSPANLHQTFSMVCSMQCCFIERVSLVHMLACCPLCVCFLLYYSFYLFYLFTFFFKFFAFCSKEITCQVFVHDSYAWVCCNLLC